MTRPAAYVWWGTVSGVLAADALLIRRDLDPVTDVCRGPAAAGFLALFGLHLLGWLGRWDPFLWLGKAAKWTPRGAHIP